MMPNNIKDLLEENENLRKENEQLLQQLREAKESIEVIKAGKIDALVTANNEEIKIYTEKTADKVYRLLIERMHEGAVTIDQTGTILYSNSSFAKLVNLPLQKAIGANFGDFIQDSYKDQAKHLLEQGWQNNIVHEVSLNSGNTPPIPVLMAASALLVDDTSVLSIILTDLTVLNENKESLKRRASEMEDMNTELEGANKELNTFNYIASHDLQEPLRKIRNFISILLKGDEIKQHDGINYLKKAQDTAIQMQKLLEDLLKYSITKSSDRKFEVLDVAAIVEEVRRSLEETLEKKKAVLEIIPPLCSIKMIRFQFFQLFQNLITNSLKFSKPGAPPYIIIKSEIVKGDSLSFEKLSQKIDYCHITYTDNGIGFDSQYKDRIFEVFQRLNSKDEYPGSGIGLAICKRIIENHHGVITATGEIGAGARFDIYVPAK
jgi:PAS domain S-box-containing protein